MIGRTESRRRPGSAVPPLLLLLGLTAFIAGCGAPGEIGRRTTADTLRVTILHTNDTHGHLLPFSYPDPSGDADATSGLGERREIGGIARRATLVRAIREETGDACLLVDAGDILDGTPFSVEYRGLADIWTMNAVGYEAMVAGNHEFNLSPAGFDSLVAVARFPILSANICYYDGGRPVLPADTLITVGGVRVGLFGLTTPGAADYPACRDRIEIDDPVETARREVRRLRERGAELLVALSHLGHAADLRLAGSVAGIDVIVGGHSHTRLAEARVIPWPDEDGPAGGTNPEEDAATRDAERSGTGPPARSTLIVQAYQWGGELGRLDLKLVPERRSELRVAHHRARLVPITREIPEDSTLAALVDSLARPMLAIYGEEIGIASADLANTGREPATVNLVADLMRSAVRTDVALQNLGGVRASIFAGPVRIWEIASMLPFGNTIVVMSLPGSRLRAALVDEREEYGFSGMTVFWDGAGPREIRIGGRLLEDEATYTLATNSYIARKCFSDVPAVRETGILLREAVIEGIRAAGRIEPPEGGRSRWAD